MFSELLSTIGEATITITTTELVLVIIALSICLLFRWNRLGMIVSYLFTFYMGWLFCKKELLSKESNEFEAFVIGYVIFGCVVLLLAVIDLFRKPGDD